MTHRKPPSIDDASIIARIDHYQSLPRDQRMAAKKQLLDEFPTLAEDLEACLNGLELLEGCAPTVATGLEHDKDNQTKLRAKEDLGDFRIIRQIGRGGMGFVYEAEQLSLGRRVALKVLPFAWMLNENQLQRFKNEANAAASLHHPHIVNAFFFGQERGVHFYAMQLIEGQSLAEIIEARTESKDADSGASTADTTQAIAALSTVRSTTRHEFFRSVARIGVEAADALDYAHASGIVHRDVKPSNILIDRHGHSWVTDFGLASSRTESNLTMTGDLLGTLRYMSPEQAEGSANVDPRTDVYSLGVTLYEFLTMKPALNGKSRGELLRQLEETEPRKPRSIDADIPRDLETIVLKAIAKSAIHRYGSAAELRDDLSRFLEDRPVRARRNSRGQIILRWARRQPLQATLVAITLMLIAILSIGGPWSAIAQRAKSRELLLRNYSLSVSAAYRAWNRNRLSEAQRHLEQFAGDDYEAIRGFEWDRLYGSLQRALDVPTADHPRS